MNKPKSTFKKPRSTLKQLKHINCDGPRCPSCGERIYRVEDPMHIKREGCKL